MKQSSNVPAFLSKLWTLVEEAHTNEFITWSQVRRGRGGLRSPWLTAASLALSRGLVSRGLRRDAGCEARGAGRLGGAGPGLGGAGSRGGRPAPGSGRGGGGVAARARGPGGPVTVRPGRPSEPARRRGATFLRTHPPARGRRGAEGTGGPGRLFPSGLHPRKSWPRRPEAARGDGHAPLCPRGLCEESVGGVGARSEAADR